MPTKAAYFKGEGKDRAFYFTKEFIDLVYNQDKEAVVLYKTALKEKMEKNTPFIYLEVY
jgi:hypothetical protein